MSMRSLAPRSARRSAPRSTPRSTPFWALVAWSVGVVPVASAHHTESYPPAQPIMNAPAWLGRLTVTNTSGGPVTLSVEGLAPRPLATWETATLSVAPGQRRVKVSYVQFGVEHVLENRRLDFYPTSSAYFAVRAERSARILVRNNYDVAATVEINDRAVALLAPHEARVLTTTAGNAILELNANGRTLDRRQMALAPFAEPTWTVNPPRTADLVVANPLPIPVVLTCDRGLVRTVAPRGQTVYDDIPLGAFHLTAKRVTGEYIDDATTAIRYDVANVWRVDAPTTGLVALDNNNPIPTRVYVDGALRATLAATVDSRLALPLGWHEVNALDLQNHRVLSTWIEVRPYDTAELQFGAPGHIRAEDHHDGAVSARDDHDRDGDARDEDRRDEDSRTDAWTGQRDDDQITSACALPQR